VGVRGDRATDRRAGALDRPDPRGGAERAALEPGGAGSGRLLPSEALRPGVAIGLGSVGFATLAGFLVLHLQASGAGHGTAVFSLFAGTVVATRLLTGRLPDRVGAARAAVAASGAEALGLVLIALAGGSWPMAAAGAITMGLGFSVLYPALALIVVDRTDEREHGALVSTYPCLRWTKRPA